METIAAAVFALLTDGCSTGSTGVGSTIQTTQSSGGTLCNLQLQYREETQVRCVKGTIRRFLTIYNRDIFCILVIPDQVILVRV